MTNKKISALPSATVPLAGTEVVPVVQSSVTDKVSVENIVLSILPSQTATGVAYLSATSSITTSANFIYLNNQMTLGADNENQLRVTRSTTTTGANYMRFNSLGGNYFFGSDSSTGGRLLTEPYAFVMLSESNRPLLFGVNNTERMRIVGTGIVTMSGYGIGTATFSAAGVISSVSDETYKIKDGVIADPMPMIMALEPGYYYGKPEANMGNGRQLGFYAQNVRAAIGPEAAPDPEPSKPWGYYDRSVLAVAIEAIKVQQAQITTLTARIAALEAR